MSYAPTFKVYGDPKYYRNGQRFATFAEAEMSAAGRYARWLQAEAYRVEETPDEPANYSYVPGVGDVAHEEETQNA